jgi:hypothetical protein
MADDLGYNLHQLLPRRGPRPVYQFILQHLCPLVAEAVEKVGWREALGIVQFSIEGTNPSRGRLCGPTRRQDEFLGWSAGPFVSKIHEANQWARNFALCAGR